MSTEIRSRNGHQAEPQGDRDPAGRHRGRSFLDRITPSMYEVLSVHGELTSAPAVSVVIPTHNRRELLRDTMSALFDQSLTESFEAIVVDDASTDGTDELLRSLAARSEIRLIAIRLRHQHGAAVARNVGTTLARGSIIAYTDSDVVPAAGWLRALLASFSPGIGVVQGPTYAHSGQPQPMFSHFIETKRLDGTFCTSNVAYRRVAVVDAGGFDASCVYSEDVDLGWRVRGLGWDVAWAADAITFHQILPVSPLGWLRHASQFVRLPAIAARYPGFRRHLVLGVWSSWWHLVFQAFVLGILLGRRRKRFLLLSLPYVALFPAKRGIRGRWPALKILFHMTRDAIACAALLLGSVRHRAPVL